MVSWVVYIAIGLIIGGAAGFFLGRLDDFSQKEKQAMQDKLDQAQKEMANYKHEVTEHFVATAGLVNNLTESYQAVHEHLAKGAKSLCDHQVAVNRLEVTRPVVIDSYNAAVPSAQESTGPETTVKSEVKIEKPSEEGVALQEDVATEAKLVAETHLNESAAEAAAQQGEQGEEQGVKPAEAHTGSNSAANAERVNQDTTSKTTTPTTTTAAADDKTVISDENDLTMASRMVH